MTDTGKSGKSGSGRTGPRTGKTAKSAKKLAKPGGKSKAAKPVPPVAVEERSLVSRLISIPGDVASGALRLAGITQSITPSPEQAELMREVGLYLRDLRQIAGLTIDELSEAISLKDHSLLVAVEKGAAVLSFDLILRLAALLARHDPFPFISRCTRTYRPELWAVLEQWGVGRLQLHLEREREFINIYRRHDAARQLSDQGFAEVLKFTQSAFEMALHFVAERESVADDKPVDDAGADDGAHKQGGKQ